MFLLRKQYILPFLEFLIGVFIGSILFTLAEFLHDTSKTCFANLGNNFRHKFGTTKVLHQKSQLQPDNKFMFIGMRSTHNLIKRRGVAAFETWAQDIVNDQENFVKLEVFAESDLEIENVDIVALKGVLRGLLVVA